MIGRGSDQGQPPIVSAPDPSSPYIDAVRSLWRKNAQSLGFFPEGAFRDHALKNQILVAVNARDEVVGYLLYRVSSRRVATIVHLCIADAARKQGVARLLVADLKKRESMLLGIGLSCRRDFAANKLWPKLGFILHSERPGRSSSGSRLVYWWYGFDHGDLFKTSSGPDDDFSVVAIDVNVLLDLYHDSHDESRGLKADWLSSVISIAITPETRAELSRKEDQQEREAALAYARQFDELQASQASVENLITLLEAAIPHAGGEQDSSDLRQIAWAAAGNADLFVTRDDFLLKSRPKIQELTGLKIYRPSELISALDSEIRPPQYQRARLAGTTSMSLGREAATDESLLAESFQDRSRSERKAEFLEPIRRVLATPDVGTLRLVRDINQKPIALAAYAADRTCRELLRVYRLRVAPSTLSTSLASYLVNLIVRSAIVGSPAVCVINDCCLQPAVVTALAREGFVSRDGVWLKLLLPGAVTLNGIIAAIATMDLPTMERRERAALDDLATVVQKALSARVPEDLLRIEQAIWPGVVKDFALPAFILPIRPAWAHHLFDEEIAEGQLFGARPDLALNDEAIYYRSSRNSGNLRAPGRLLWYVSQDSKMLPIGQIRAVSYLNEVSVGSAADLFRQFRRLGIYEWKHVLETARGDPEGAVMAIRFSKTTPLAHPVSYSEVQACLKARGVRSKIQSPVEIPSSLWMEWVHGQNEQRVKHV